MGLWRHREFVKLWAASAISDFGSEVSALALPLIAALTLGATPWQMGLLSAAGTAPILLVGLFAGVWVDRVRRRPVMVVGDLARAVLLLVIPSASLLGLLRIELLYVVAFLVGSFTVLFDVAHLAFVPFLVEREDLVEGNSKLETTWSLAKIAGPGLGGVLVSVLGAPLAIVVDALSFAGSAAFLGRIHTLEAPPSPASERRGVLAEIAEGLRLVLGHRILRVLAACSGTTNLFGHMFLAVYVLYMTRDLGLGPMAIGLVLAIGGVGSLAGALVAGPITRRFGVGPTMLWAQLLFGVTGLAVPLAVLVPSVALVMIVASEFAQWMAFIVYVVNAVSIRQSITPHRLLGRVSATMRFAIGGAMPVGSLLGGALGSVIGLPWTLVVAELGTLVGFLWLWLSPVGRLQTLPTLDGGEPWPADAGASVSVTRQSS
jgi:MFS family permease